MLCATIGMAALAIQVILAASLLAGMLKLRARLCAVVVGMCTIL